MRLLSEAGDLLFETDGITGGVGPAEGAPSVELAAGPHLVECLPEGGTPTAVPLEVVA